MLEILKSNLSRIFMVLLAIIASFTGGDMTKAQFEIKNEVTTQSEKIVYEMKNYTGKQLGADENFTLEIYENGEWTELEQTGMVNDIAVTIDNLESSTGSIDIIHAFGKPLDAGHYRLTKDYGNHLYSAEFNVN